jgi:hypothetical protein
MNTSELGTRHHCNNMFASHVHGSSSVDIQRTQKADDTHVRTAVALLYPAPTESPTSPSVLGHVRYVGRHFRTVLTFPFHVAHDL